MTTNQTLDISSVAKELSARYKLLQPIGKTGSSIVYLAQDQFEQREVAIKIAHFEVDQNTDEKLHQLWIKEVRMSGQLKHPFIVDIYEAGLINGNGYIVMEYLSGGTLVPFVRPDKLLPIERVVEILFKVCKALEYVYSIGILHRHIKPSNIHFNHEGEIKVSDFGFRYKARVDDTQTLDAIAQDYDPPEQVNNKFPNVQFDIYAIGVLAYQLITGQTLNVDNDSEIQVFHKLYDCPNTSVRLSEIIMQAIARDPARRYKSWEVLSNDLANLSVTNNSSELCNDSSKYASLSDLDFFKEFDQKELWETVQLSNWIRYTPRESIIREGDIDSSIYVIIIGEADIVKQKVIINHITKGSCFGELAFINKEKQLRTADVIASTILVALCIDGERLRKASDGLQARFSSAFLRAMLNKINQSDRRIIALA
jgi:serine/threonine protein kinase